MAKLADIIKYLDLETRRADFKDFEGAFNGLQFGEENSSADVSKICCAVDAGLYQFERAKKIGAGLIIVHHGMLWNGAAPYTGAHFQKLKTLFEGGVRLYSSHLPLDAHDVYGNNAQIAAALGLKVERGCFEYYGNLIGKIAPAPAGGRAELAKRLKKLFGASYKAVEFGSKSPKKIAICSGSASESVFHLKEEGVDTLVTGELKEHFFEVARDLKLNLYPCGHYATECFGVKALCAAAAKKFGLDWEFIGVDNPL